MSFTLSNIAPEIEHITIDDFDHIPKYRDIDKIVEYSLPLSYHKDGSRVIQDIYEHNPEYRETIFQKIFEHIFSLSVADIGNFFIQKIIECDADKRVVIFNLLKNNLINFSFARFGTHVIQKLIKNIPEEYLADISKEFNGHYVELALDEYGNQALQILIAKQGKKENEKVYKELKRYLIFLINNQFSYCIIKQLLLNCDDKTYNEIFYIALQYLKVIIFDQFGNYLIQFFLEQKKGNYLDNLFQLIQTNIFYYSKDEFAINVVETALKEGNDLQRKFLINEILRIDKNQKDFIISLAQDECGNYLVQLIYELGEEKTRKIIEKKIKSIDLTLSINNKENPANFVMKKIKNLKQNEKGALNNYV